MRISAVPVASLKETEEALSTSAAPPISLAKQRMSGTLAMSTSVHVRPVVVSVVGILAGDTGPASFALTVLEDFTQPPTTARLPASPRPPSGRPTTERRLARLEYFKDWTAEPSLLLVVASSEEEKGAEEGGEDAIGELNSEWLAVA